jgi:hypothetical protein
MAFPQCFWGQSATVFATTALLAAASFGQAAPANGDSATSPDTTEKRILGVIPNNRTSPTLTNYKPLTPKEKFKIALNDSFDPGTLAVAAGLAGEGLFTKSNPSFGSGITGYSRYLATAYADQVIGNFMTEAIYPALLHQDPRYFRRGTGSKWSRLGYAVGQIFWTHTDSGGTQFNYSEIAGNSTAVAIACAYYPEGRDVSGALSKLGSQIGVDGVGNILKEFWPDIHRKFTRDRKAPDAAAPASVENH